jgi:hypothetical protein
MYHNHLGGFLIDGARSSRVILIVAIICQHLNPSAKLAIKAESENLNLTLTFFMTQTEMRLVTPPVRDPMDPTKR